MKRVKEEPKPCKACGVTMYRKRYGVTLEDMRVFNKRQHCSRSCGNTRKELTKHGYSWRARKHLKNSCESCGEKRSLHAHHIDQDIKNNNQENIQTLCKWCHNFHHATAKRIGQKVAGKMASQEWLMGFPEGHTDLNN